ncbi:MAG: hypothetical protein HQK70_07605 [Desulfamplus sp.]|nr:hypothetical protein [Desulfamplus sp.]
MVEDIKQNKSIDKKKTVDPQWTVMRDISFLVCSLYLTIYVFFIHKTPKNLETI